MGNSPTNESLLGQSDAFLSVLDQVSRAAPLNKPILIIGERGTGKELIAARLHFLSERWQQNYVSLNCAALSEALLESELFGHESGAFTGASKRHHGRFERADDGTLFLDELANTPSLVQEKLLRVIEYGEFERVGGSKPIQVNVRLIAATNEDLPTLAEQGKFRSDLLDRLSFDVITLPPLRERPEDILLLAEKFAIDMAKELGHAFFAGFSPRACSQLMSYHWPGNIRELKNVVERAVYRNINIDKPITHLILDPFASPYRPNKDSLNQTASSSLSSKVSSQKSPQTNEQAEINTETRQKTGASPQEFVFPLDFKQQTQNYEINILKNALKSAQFNQRKTADILGVTYHQLRGYLKKYNLLEQSNS
ncbi:phage shock protein operon transcriptional activator [Saccharobesus litoralis]|uniref:Phage shock protein operon transcriptional activator n=1 Tax=Saccharobesus litoralis TaxID=2172099 RepID=A0A2S0VSA8_9ALTE|nr:phage shock protein operon transcriptional activator [Saccharobesus litoralis]AWB67098.1 phage shock protein operon transcriptional activator [Saccharobesus litoralis]